MGERRTDKALRLESQRTELLDRRRINAVNIRLATKARRRTSDKKRENQKLLCEVLRTEVEIERLRMADHPAERRGDERKSARRSAGSGPPRQRELFS